MTYLDCILSIADTIPGYSSEQLRSDILRRAERSAATQTLSVAEAAARLKIALSTARKWIASGRLPVRHVGGRVLVMQSDIEEILAHGIRENC